MEDARKQLLEALDSFESLALDGVREAYDEDPSGTYDGLVAMQTKVTELRAALRHLRAVE